MNQEKLQSRLEKTSQNFRTRFLLKFTKEVIKHTKIEEFFKLERIIDRRDKISNIRVNERPDEMMPSIMYSQPKQFFKPATRPALQIPQIPSSAQPRQVTQQRPIPRGPLRIPENPLPQTVRNISPSPTPLQLDLGKLNPLLQNPRTMSVECNGPEERVVAKSQMGSQSTNIILNKDEIDAVIRAFSEATKIPIHEGVFKIAAGNLIISAIISELIGSKFIIRKMVPQHPRF